MRAACNGRQKNASALPLTRSSVWRARAGVCVNRRYARAAAVRWSVKRSGRGGSDQEDRNTDGGGRRRRKEEEGDRSGKSERERERERNATGISTDT